MHPAHHESALAAFFRRHGLVAPHIDCDGLIERYGLVLAMGFAARDAGFRAQPDADGGFRFGERHFPLVDWLVAGNEAHRLAHLVADIADGKRLADRAADYTGLVDYMALTMRRLDRAGIPATPDTLAQEGFTAAEIAECGLEAAQLAEAMSLAMRRYHAARRKAAEAQLEAA